MTEDTSVIGKEENKYKNFINILSIAIPIAVAILIGIRTKIYLGEWTKVLPHVIGFINSVTAILLVLGLFFIRQNNVKWHKAIMLGAFVMGSLFLICYITYHLSNPSTPFGGEGISRPIYYFLLITHIGLSIGVVRLVLLAVYYAITDQSVTGVLVYLMISPYYRH